MRRAGLLVALVDPLLALTPRFPPSSLRQSAYNASKAATTAFTQSLAAEWAHTGFRINCISPGYIYSGARAASRLLSSLSALWR